ncbi:hypothetical protein B566_EDAN016262 [Ephemera danica]|nr:hypothetical protein B566_EDAN016262 [Ephemera danica]
MSQTESVTMRKTVAAIAIFLQGVLLIFSGPAAVSATACGFGATVENLYRTSSGMPMNQIVTRIVSVLEVDLCVTGLQLLN